VSRKRVVLYNPRAVFFTMPLSLLAVGSHLDPSRYEVVVVDARLEDDPVVALLSQLDGAVCLGVTVLTGAPIQDALVATRTAKARFPRLPVVWGGWHPSLFPLDCLEEPLVDAIVAGQGEETFAELVDRFAEGASIDGCAGIASRRGGERVLSPPRPFSAPDSFRPHDYGLVPVERYFERKGKRQLDYISSQGCRFRCAFCADPQVFGRQWAALSPSRVGEELALLHSRHRFDDVNFQDETYFTHPGRVAAIAEELLARSLPVTWAATMRADQGERLSEEIWALCKRSGLRRVMIGVESGSPEVLVRIQKDIRLEQVLACAERCLRSGLGAIFPFIVCFPGESDEEIAASLDFARRLRAMSPSFQTPVFYFKPYPGNPLTDEAVQDGLRLPRTLEEWGRFDIYDARSPWVTRKRERLVEGFKHYVEVAYGAEPPAWRRPLRRVARWRCERRAFSFPVGMAASRLVSPSPQLS
jgi:radical SAM superfamily enzyme YgiQ (UPF0313 family)